jgi:hypothetical protein
MHIRPPSSVANRFLLLAALLLLPVVLWFGTRNRPDPAWIEAGKLVRQPHLMLESVPDSLQWLYNCFHKTNIPNDSSALQLVFRPSVPNMQWSKFRDFCLNWQEKRFLVLSGVTGSGLTNLATRSANLFAAKPATNLLSLSCSPQFDLELHRKYIGYEDDKGVFHQGRLLDFWKTCHERPNELFVALIDNFDKINPETFFGPELWEGLSSSTPEATIGGQKIRVPNNFYMLSVTHLGPGARIEFNEEHFRRLGRQYVLEPNAVELVGYLRRQAKRLNASLKPDANTAKQLAALNDTANMQRFLFYFLKTNQLIEKRYAPGYQLGQSSNVRQLYMADDLDNLKTTFINHINALQPNRTMTKADFESMDYTVRNKGLESGSNFLSHQVQFLYDTGYFVEVTMVAATALLTFLIGLWVFRRRERLIRRYGERAQKVFQDFETQQISAEAASKQLEEIKFEVDGLVFQRKLNYTEGLYFLAFIDDRAKRIEYARSVSENFLELFNAFMEDDILTENEYLKLKQFLQSIRHKVPLDVHEQFRQKVEQAYTP